MRLFVFCWRSAELLSDKCDVFALVSLGSAFAASAKTKGLLGGRRNVEKQDWYFLAGNTVALAMLSFGNSTVVFL